MQSGQNTYKYYAFISYSRKNSKASKYLQVELEHFRIPVKYVAEENRPQGQTYLRPIFRDRRDLKVGEESFTEDIKAAVAQSRYLIVLCSPEAAASDWVEEEIKHFLATHNNNYRAIASRYCIKLPQHRCCVQQARQISASSGVLPQGVGDKGKGIRQRTSLYRRKLLQHSFDALQTERISRVMQIHEKSC